MATYVINRTRPSQITRKTPYELFYKREADVTLLQEFESRVSVHIPEQNRMKWDSKTQEGIFVGYGENVKGYRLYFPQ